MTISESVRLYHAHHSLYPEDLAMWLGLAKAHGGPLLELGCGSGRVLLPLAQAGYAVTGLDNDPAMLELLRSHWPPELGQPDVHLADFTAFDLGRQFPLIILPCNTYSTLSAAARQALLGCVAQHCHKTGVFAVSLPNPLLLQDLPARSAPEVEETFAHPLDGEPVQVSSGWRRTKQEFILTWHYDHLLPDGQTRRTSLEARHQLAAPQDYLSELAEAGLPQVMLFGDYDGSDFERESPQLIIIAAH